MNTSVTQLATTTAGYNTGNFTLRESLTSSKLNNVVNVYNILFDNFT